MTLFYAYLKNSTDDATYRYIITFVNREAADEWWRLVSTSPSPYAGNVERLAPQFYVQTRKTGNVVDFFTNSLLPDAKKFFLKMFFTLLDDKGGRDLSIAPPIKVTDNISGRWYFVRSQDDPNRHWYYGGLDSHIQVSIKRRSRFYIQVRNGDFQAPKDFVIIGSDKVSFTTSNDYVLYVDSARRLTATKDVHIPAPDTLFFFSDLKDRFVTSATTLANGEVVEHVNAVDRGSGEVWELSA